jgi:hypothetical protein
MQLVRCLYPLLALWQCGRYIGGYLQKLINILSSEMPFVVFVVMAFVSAVFFTVLRLLLVGQ